MQNPSKFFPFKLRNTLLLGAAGLSLAGTAFAQQTVFSDNFEDTATNTPYIYGDSVSDQNGWVTNDEDTGATYQGSSIGQSETVNFVNGFSTGQADHVAVFGGAFAPGTYSGTATPYISHSFNLGGATSSTYNLDFGVTQSGGSFTKHDSFGFAFNNADTSSPAPLFSINFVPRTDKSATFDNVSYTAGTATGAATTSFQLGLRYHLTVTVTGSGSGEMFSASYFRELANGTSAGEGVFSIANNVAFTGTIAGLAATWNLADPSGIKADGGTTGGNNFAYTDPGSNLLLFDNIVVAVPEPSTYALLGVGALGLLGVRRLRRSALV